MIGRCRTSTEPEHAATIPVNAKHIFIVGLMALLAGCATPFGPPADVAHIKLERVGSPVVLVEKIWLERKADGLAVAGYVLKHLDGGDTDNTHLDVTLYDARSNVLRSTVEHFEPRHLVRQFRRPAYGSYRVLLDPLPAGTVRIEVRAHDGTHATNTGYGTGLNLRFGTICQNLLATG